MQKYFGDFRLVTQGQIFGVFVCLFFTFRAIISAESTALVIGKKNKMVQGLFISVVVHFLVVKSWSPTTTEQERGGTTLPGKRIGFRGIAVRASVSTSEDGLKFADFLENKLRNFYGFFLLSFNTNNSIEIQINFTWHFYVW